MKKGCLILLITVATSSTYAQSFEQRFTDSLCVCFNSILNTTIQDAVLDEFTESCFQQVLVNFEKDLLALDTSKTKSSYEIGYQAGWEMAEKSMVLMVSRCDNYYVFMDAIRKHFTKISPADELKKEIEWQTDLINVGATYFNYFRRAQCYAGLDEYELAIQDLNKAIQLDKNFPEAFTLLGMMYEFEGEFDKALESYNQTKLLSGQNDVDVFIAIVNRKISKK